MKTGGHLFKIDGSLFKQADAWFCFVLIKPKQTWSLQIYKETLLRVGAGNLTKAKNSETLLKMNPSQVTPWNFSLKLDARNFITNDLFVRYKPTTLEVEVCNFMKIVIFHRYFSSILLYFNQFIIDF